MPRSSDAASPHRDEQVGTTEYREFSTQPQRFPALSSAEITSIWRLSGNILLVGGVCRQRQKSSHRAAEETGSVGTEAENYVSKEREDLI